MPGRSWKLYDRPPSVGGRKRDGEIGHQPGPRAAADPPEAREPVVREREHLHLGPVIRERRVDGVVRGTRRATPARLSVPPRWPAPEARTATKSRPEATTIPSGRLPVVTVWTRPVAAGSILESVPASSLLTQTAAGETAMPFGPSPTGIVARTTFDAGIDPA